MRIREVNGWRIRISVSSFGKCGVDMLTGALKINDDGERFWMLFRCLNESDDCEPGVETTVVKATTAV